MDKITPVYERDNGKKLLLGSEGKLSVVGGGTPMTAGMLGYTYNDAGTLKVKPAIATAENTCADCIIRSDAAIGTEEVIVDYIGNNRAALSDPAIVAADFGEVCWLSDTAAGKVTSVAPTTVGSWRQKVGKIIALDAIFFDAEEPQEIVS